MGKQYELVTTTCKKDLWLKAKIAEISWTQALEVGITTILGIEKTEEDGLLEKINNHTGVLNALKIELNNLRNEKERARIKAMKDKKISDKEILTELTRQQEEMKRVNPARW